MFYSLVTIKAVIASGFLSTVSLVLQVLSLKLDDWTNEQVDALIEMGGNNAVNLKYEANIPEYYSKPNPDSSTDDRTDFIRYYKLHHVLAIVVF